jgi:hypothetical protein
MKTSPRTILAAALALVICVGCVLLGIYPYRPADIRGWLILVAIAAPILGAYELIGSKLFSPSLGKRMNRSARIAYGVVVALMVIALSWLLFKMAQPYLTTWGA